jgi:ABC-type cobalamin/Fe3+-siderophores transport system ATPase subunit
MKVIRDIIDLDDRGEKTSIIVTHDINLTLRFADRIVPIKTVKYGNTVDNRIYGKIDSKDVYKSKLVDGCRLWFDSRGDHIPENQMKIILFELLKREL